MARVGRIIGGRFRTSGSNSSMRAARARNLLRRGMRRRGAVNRVRSRRVPINSPAELRRRRAARLIQRVGRGMMGRRSVRPGSRSNPIML